MTPPTPRLRTHARGFNLIEVMVSMGIFVIAFVAVASIFPTAITLQREASRKVDDFAAETSAEAIINAIKLTHTAPASNGLVDLVGITGGGVSNGDDGPYRLQPLLDDLDGSTQDLPFPVRTFGANPIDANAPDERRYVWIPMIQPTQDPPSSVDHWRLLIVLLRRDVTSRDTEFTASPKSFLNSPTNSWASEGDWSDASAATRSNDSGSKIPGLNRIPVNPSAAQLDAGRFQFTNQDAGGNFRLIEGDTFLDNFGTIHVVESADATGINVAGSIPPNPYDSTLVTPRQLWYAPRPLAEGTTDVRPDDAPSPLVKIIDASASLRD